jgi:DNA repair protein RAD50
MSNRKSSGFKKKSQNWYAPIWLTTTVKRFICLMSYLSFFQTEENDQKSLQIDQLKKDIANQALNERELVDNLELKKLQNEETKLVDDLNELLKEIGDLDPGKMNKEKEELHRKQTDLFAKKNSIDGQMAELRNQIQTIKGELEKPRYKQSIKNYLNMFNEVTVIKRIVDDLHNYRSVLEWALLKYHAEKMEQINRSIKMLWREIYK